MTNGLIKSTRKWGMTMINIKRSNHKIIAGVAGGIAENFGWAVLPIRLIFLLFSFSGFGIFAYLLLWAIMESPSE